VQAHSRGFSYSDRDRCTLLLRSQSSFLRRDSSDLRNGTGSILYINIIQTFPLRNSADICYAKNSISGLSNRAHLLVCASAFANLTYAFAWNDLSNSTGSLRHRVVCRMVVCRKKYVDVWRGQLWRANFGTRPKFELTALTRQSLKRQPPDDKIICVIPRGEDVEMRRTGLALKRAEFSENVSNRWSTRLAIVRERRSPSAAIVFSQINFRQYSSGIRDVIPSLLFVFASCN